MIARVRLGTELEKKERKETASIAFEEKVHHHW